MHTRMHVYMHDPNLYTQLNAEYSLALLLICQKAKSDNKPVSQITKKQTTLCFIKKDNDSPIGTS